jgi:hypothetical protein
MISSDGSTLITDTLVSGKQGLDVNIINTVLTVSATDLDIRDLTHVSDSVKIGDGTDFLAIAADGSIAVTDNGGSLTVDATDLDIRDLSASQDNVAISDGTDTMAVNTDGSINTQQSSPNTAIAAAAETLDVASTAQDIIVAPLANRKSLRVYNADNRECYIGQSGVTPANGYPIPSGSELPLLAGPSIDIEFVSAKLNHEIRTLEIS